MHENFTKLYSNSHLELELLCNHLDDLSVADVLRWKVPECSAVVAMSTVTHVPFRDKRTILSTFPRALKGHQNISAPSKEARKQLGNTDIVDYVASALRFRDAGVGTISQLVDLFCRCATPATVVRTMITQVHPPVVWHHELKAAVDLRIKLSQGIRHVNKKNAGHTEPPSNKKPRIDN